MKTYLLLGALLCSHVQGAGETYTNFVRQTQQSTGVVWSMPVNPTGNSDSKMTLEEGGALFQLWTIAQAGNKEYLLDQKLVGAYLPKADIVINTVDPVVDRETGARRTRADMPFSVTTTVRDLKSGLNLPLAATKVLQEHHLASFSGNTSTITAAQATSGAPKSSRYISVNGTTTESFGATNLPAVAGSAAKAKGQEHFVVHALSDGTLSQTQIASNYVQVWPATTGSINGIVNGERVRTKLPKLTIILNDLYPDSRTYLQIYRGTQALGTKGEVMIDKLDRPNTNNYSITPAPLGVEDYDSYLPEDGVYTIELVTETSFDRVRLAWVTVTVDRLLEIHGQLSNLDAR